MRPDLFVVDPDPDRCEQLADAADQGGQAQTCASPGVLVQHLHGRPGVVVFGPGVSDGAGLAAIGSLLREHPEIAAILVSEDLSPSVFQQAIRLGIRDVLGMPVDGPALRESIDHVAQTLVAASASMPVTAVPTVQERGRAITVWSTKGGAGRSVVATNLAVSLARRCEEPVALVDADLAFGDAAILLRLVGTHSVVDAVTSLDRADAQLLQSMMVRHAPSGLLVLPAPVEPFMAEHVGASDLTRVVDILQSFCRYVVVDTPAQLNEVVVGLVEHADDVVVVGGMDVPNIKNVKLGLQTLRLLSVPEDKLRLVINHSNSKLKVEIGDVERALGLKAEGLIPRDVAIPQTVNKGNPVVLDDPGSEVARAFEALADRFCDGTPALAASGASHSRFNFF
jgi:pilus assembly protein CpaE